MTDDPFDHNAECRFCDEQGAHRADCEWLLRLQADVVRLEEAATALGAQWKAVAAERDRLRAALDDIATADPTMDDARALISVAQVALVRKRPAGVS